MPAYGERFGHALCVTNRMATTITDSEAHASAPHSAAKPPRTWRSRARSAIAAVAVGLLLLALGYGGGRLHEWYRSRAAEARLEAGLNDQRRLLEDARLEHERALREVQQQLEAAQSLTTMLSELNRLYEAYRRSQQALSALDARNFGIAQSHVQEIGALLDPLAPEVDGVSPIRTRAGEIRLEVASNLAAQREELAHIVTSLDALLTRERSARGLSPSP